MEKIPTLFLRTEDRRHLTNEIDPRCQWVKDGEGHPTRKLDGICVRVHDGQMYERREVKPEGSPPPGFEPVAVDEDTGKTFGWVPVENTKAFARNWEAWNSSLADLPDGTYELIGPKVNGNPERVESHVLVPHGSLPLSGVPMFADFTFPNDPDQLAAVVSWKLTLETWLGEHDYEGIVWWHEDGRKAKLKKRDFRQRR